MVVLSSLSVRGDIQRPVHRLKSNCDVMHGLKKGCVTAKWVYRVGIDSSVRGNIEGGSFKKGKSIYKYLRQKRRANMTILASP